MVCSFDDIRTEKLLALVIGTGSLILQKFEFQPDLRYSPASLRH